MCSYYLNDDTKAFNKKRNELLKEKCFVKFPDNYISLTDGSYYSTAYNDNFYCIYYSENGVVKVSDSFWINAKGKRELFYLLSKETDAKEYEIDFCSDNNSCRKGVVIQLNDDFLNDNRIYLGNKME